MRTIEYGVCPLVTPVDDESVTFHITMTKIVDKKQPKNRSPRDHGLAGSWPSQQAHDKRSLQLRLFTSPQTRKQRKESAKETPPCGIIQLMFRLCLPTPQWILSRNVL